MEWIQAFFRTVYNVPELIRLVGLYGMIFIVFAETGLMVGFFLPGDSLLVTAGLFAAKGDLNISDADPLPDRRGHRRQRHRLLHRAQGGAGPLQPAELAAVPARAPHPDPRVLRAARRQDDHPRAVHADRPHVRPRRRRRRRHDLPPLRDLQRRRRDPVDHVDDASRASSSAGSIPDLEKRIHLRRRGGDLPVAAARDHRVGEIEARERASQVGRPARRTATSQPGQQQRRRARRRRAAGRRCPPSRATRSGRRRRSADT